MYSYDTVLVNLFSAYPKMIKRVQRIDESIEVYDLQESFMYNRLLKNRHYKYEQLVKLI